MAHGASGSAFHRWKGPDGVRLSYQSTYDYFYNCNGLITRDCEHPWEAAQLFDLLASAEGTMVQNYGPEGIGWEWCDTSVGSGINGSRALYRVNMLKIQNNAWPPDVQICSLYDTFRRGRLVEEGVLNGEDILWQCAATYEPLQPRRGDGVPQHFLSSGTVAGPPALSVLH